MPLLDPQNRPEGLDHPLVPKILRIVSKWNVAAYRATNGFLGGTWRVGAAFPRGVPICLLTTIGRKTGERRTAPVLFLQEGRRVVVVGSQGGMKSHPLWYLNLKANPECEVQVKGEVWKARAHTADATERAHWWPKLVAHYADFATYEAWTDREIPVVILDPV